MSGRHIDSHIPSREEGAVPATMKSLAVSIAPIESVPAKYGVKSGCRPAITGLTKYGPNLEQMLDSVTNVLLYMSFSFPYSSEKRGSNVATACGELVKEECHLFSYSVEDTSSAKVDGFMFLSSRNLYMLCLKMSLWYLIQRPHSVRRCLCSKIRLIGSGERL